MSDKQKNSYVPVSRRSVSTSAAVRRARAVSTVSVRGHGAGARDTVLEIRRHVASVAQHSRSVAENFAEQLKKYKTFAPLLATGGVYSEVSFPSWTQGAATSLDSILDARTSFLVRHTTHHRIVPADRKAAQPPGRNRVVTMEGDAVGFDENAAVMSAAADDPVFQMWLQANPKATPKEKMVELGRRRKEIVEKERESRSKYLRKWHTELDMLLEEQRPTAEDQSDTPTPVFTPKPPSSRFNREDYDAQKTTWDVFLSVMEPSANNDMDGPPHRILTGNDGEVQHLHNWVDGGWHHHTHRHEAAALIIQCAFRCYRSKSNVQRRRYLRAQSLQERLKAEEEAMYAWRVAVQVMTDASANRDKSTDDEVEATLRGMNFFIQSVNAKVGRRRAEAARKQGLDLETQSYAAVRIQALYRGHRGRTTAREVRCPEIGERRREQIESVAAVKIQKIWRGVRLRMTMVKKQKAALQIQMAFRQSVALRVLQSLRRETRKEEQLALQTFAANRIKKFLGEMVLKRRIKYRKAMPILIRLFPIGRAWIVRRSLYTTMRTRKIRAIVRLQAIARMWLAKALMRSRKSSVLALYANDRQDEAATNIQRVYRGGQGRQKAALAKDEKTRSALHNKESDAAVTIQSAFRAHRSREHYKTRRENQSNECSEVSEIEHRQHDAAYVIQQFYFNCIRRTKLKRFLVQTTKRITRFLRRAPALKVARERRDNITRIVEDEAAMSIQTALRAHQAKTYTAQLKQQRDDDHSALRKNEAAVVITKFFRYVQTKRRLQRKQM